MPKQNWKNEEFKREYEYFKERLEEFKKESEDKSSSTNRLSEQGKELVDTTHEFMNDIERLDDLYNNDLPLDQQSDEYIKLARDLAERAVKAYKQSKLWDTESDHLTYQNDELNRSYFFWDLSNEYEYWTLHFTAGETAKLEIDNFNAISVEAESILKEISVEVEYGEDGRKITNDVSDLKQLAGKQVAVGIMLHDAAVSNWDNKGLYDPNDKNYQRRRNKVKKVFSESVDNMTKQIQAKKLLENENNLFTKQNINNYEMDIIFDEDDSRSMRDNLEAGLKVGSQEAVLKLTGKPAADVAKSGLSVDKALQQIQDATKKREQELKAKNDKVQKEQSDQKPT